MILPPDSMISTATKPYKIILKTAIKYSTTVHKLSSQHIGTRIV